MLKSVTDQGAVPRKMVKFNPGLSQLSSAVEIAQYC